MANGNHSLVGKQTGALMSITLLLLQMLLLLLLMLPMLLMLLLLVVGCWARLSYDVDKLLTHFGHILFWMVGQGFFQACAMIKCRQMHIFLIG